MAMPEVTIVVPSFNQGRFLHDALESIFSQKLDLEVFVCDAGSTDNSLEIIQKFAPQLSGWRSHRDSGQSAAINEGIAQGSAQFVYWLNSDDWLLPNGLKILVDNLQMHPEAPACFGRVWNYNQKTGRNRPVWIQELTSARMARRCVVSQPGTLVRRSAWEAVGGLDTSLHMTMDYDLWWKLFKKFGSFPMVNEYVAVNREHAETKTRRLRRKHYREAIATVRKHYGYAPAKWWLYYPYAVWWKAFWPVQ
jgi:glycosyltransferase involved in cell wall biosynthesis